MLLFYTLPIKSQAKFIWCSQHKRSFCEGKFGWVP